MGPSKTDVIVIGEGITGLCIAYWLKKQGIDVKVLAKDHEVGGTMKSYTIKVSCMKPEQTLHLRRRYCFKN